MLSKRKIAPSSTLLFSSSILLMICNIDPNKITNSIHHRVRELNLKLKKIKVRKLKISKTKKYLENSITRSLEIREIAKELESLALKIRKLHDKVIQADIKNSIHLARSASKSALENIKVNKSMLAKLK